MIEPAIPLIALVLARSKPGDPSSWNSPLRTTFACSPRACNVPFAYHQLSEANRSGAFLNFCAAPGTLLMPAATRFFVTSIATIAASLAVFTIKGGGDDKRALR